MPRAVDAALLNGAQLPIDRDPTQRSSFQPPKIEFQFSLQDFIDQWMQFIDEYLLDFIEDATGIDLRNMPVVGDIIEILTGIEDGDLNDLGTWVGNLLRNFDGFEFGRPLLEQIFETGTQIIAGILEWIVRTFLNPFGMSVPGDVTAALKGFFAPFLDNFDGTLESFIDIVEDNIDGTWTFIENEIHQAIDNFDGTIVSMQQQIQNFFNGAGTFQNTIQETWRTIMAALDVNKDGEVNLNDVFAAFQGIPPSNSLGTGGPATQQATWQTFWDSLWTGLNLDQLFGTGKTMTDVANAAEQLSRAVANHESTLGLRGNRPVFNGLDSAAESVFPLSQLSSSYISLNNTFSPISFIRAERETVYGKISWLGYNTVNITDMRIDVYRMDTDGRYGNNIGDMYLVQSSPNLIGEVSDALAWNTWDFTDGFLGTADAGSVWGIRMRITGTGTYMLAALLGRPNISHPDVWPRAMSAVHAAGSPPAYIPRASITWDDDVAWFGFGLGDQGWHDPVLKEFHAGVHTFDIASWANYVDIAALSGSGGGKAGDFIQGFGGGGRSGRWVTATLQRGVHFHQNATTMTVIVGGPGTGGIWVPGSGSQNGGPGGDTIVQYTDTSSGTSQVYTQGGAGGTGFGAGADYSVGLGPGSVDYAGRRFYGGEPQYVTGSAGNDPGGGGAGGRNAGPQSGGNGAPGVVWTTSRQA